MKPTKLVLLTGLLCAALFAGSPANQTKDKKAEVALQAAIKTETVDGNLKGAIEQYKKIVAQPGAGRTTVATALLRMGQCHEKLGNAEARTAYERLVREFTDQAEIVAQARVRLAALGGPGAGGGLVTRRVLTDVSGVVEVLTADGKYIRGIDWDTGDVVQFEVASGQTTRITNRGGPEAKEGPYEYQAFSRDGKQIAYDWYTKDWVPQLRIRNLDGSGLRTLYSEKGYDVRPLDWSPDAGSILALRERNKAVELTLISTADGSVRVLRSIASAWAMWKSASFSPDGRFVAISLVGEGSPPHSGDVFLMTADGRNEVVVAGHPAEDRLLGWTPDGRSLLFLSDRSGTWDIWSVHITGGKQQGEPELLKKDFGWDSYVLGLTPDGSLYYKTDTSSGRFYNGEVDLETGKVLVPPAPVTTRYTGPPFMSTWSPDGRNLAYISRMGTIGPGNNILTIRSAATGEERFLSPRLRGVAMPSWAPDGRSVIAVGVTESRTGIFRIDAETSAITKLADQSRFAPRLCPDGKTLVFVTDGIIRKRNLDTGDESEVIKAGMFYDLSPDGREVVFQVNDTVKTVSLNGGEPRELFHGLAKSYALKWTRNGRYIIAQACGTASSEIWRVPAQGGTPLKLDLSVPKMDDFSFALHPDNRRFAFSVTEESKSELWVLENFLPPLKVAK
jgi:Tol biopolymer transport system component